MGPALQQYWDTSRYPHQRNVEQGPQGLIYSQHRFHPTLRLTESKIRQLVDDYWNGNPNNRHKSLQDLRNKILYCIKRYDCRCASRHTCQLRNYWSIPHALLEILQKHLHLEVEGMSDSLHHSTLFGTWISAYKSDKSFGAQPIVWKKCIYKPLLII